MNEFLLKRIASEVKNIFKGNNNLKKCEVIGDFIHLDFKDVNDSPEPYENMREFIEHGLLEKSIDLNKEGLTICYCDGDWMSIQEKFI
jgi:hypothetical protein